MNLKTSLFNKTLIKSDLKRFWWLGVLNVLAILIFAVYPIYQKINYENYSFYVSEIDREFSRSDMYTTAIICVPIIVVFCVFAALLVFSYINGSASVSFMHGIPLKRTTHYASRILSGLMLIMAPAVICAVIILIMRINSGFAYRVSVSEVFKWLYIYMVYALIVFSGTVFSAFLTGNSFAAAGIAGTFALTPIILTSFFDTFLQDNIYGYYRSSIYSWLSYIYIEPLKILTSRALIYWAVSAILIVSACFIYKIRHLENYGEVIAFSKLRPVFVYAAAFFAGILGYMYCASVSNSSNLWWILLFGLLGAVAAFMISNKSFNLKGIWKPSSVIFLCFILFFVCVKYDIFGYEKRIPDLSKIEGVDVSGNIMRELNVYIPGVGEGSYAEVYNPILTEKDDIENIRLLNKYLIENREHEDKELGVSIPIVYKLSNGSTLQRSYFVPRKRCEEFLKAMYETDEIKAANYPVTDSTQKEIVSISVSDVRFSNMDFFENDKDTLNEITEAFKKDIENLKYEDDYEANAFVVRPCTRITFRYWKPIKSSNGKQVTEEQMKLNAISEEYYINPHYTNTMAKLTELGFFADAADVSQIKRMGVSVYTEEDYGIPGYVVTESYVEEYYKDYESSAATENQMKIYSYKSTDAAEIAELYDLVLNKAIYDTNKGFVHFQIGFETDKGLMCFELTYDENSIPEPIKKIMDKISQE